MIDRMRKGNKTNMPDRKMKLTFLKGMWVSLFTLISFILILPGYAGAEKVKQRIKRQQLIPACLLEWKNGPDYAVLVDKSRQKVMVYERDNIFQPYRVYGCSTGESDGPKTKKNDRKTPEGIYFFTDIHEDKYLAPIYGTMALPINYPNLIDEKEGKGGYGIWFHGTNKPLKPNDTNGCIAMDNRDIEDLANLVKLFDTPVIVSSEIKMVPPESLENDKQELMSIIENWRASWQDKDVDKYMSFYSRKFTSGWKNWGQWKEYKARLARKYKSINVEIDELELLALDGVILATFKQTYSTPGFESYGKKTLYITRNSAEWKIIGETFRDEKKSKPVSKQPEPFNIKEVEAIIFDWKDAWENKELDRYISYYDKDFKSRGMDLRRWKEHRNRLNIKYGSIRVDISDIKIKSISNKSASVSFRQDYTADTYRDKGIKEIILVRKGKDWKIRKEEWTPISRRSRP